MSSLRPCRTSFSTPSCKRQWPNSAHKTLYTVTGSELYEVAKFQGRRASSEKIFATRNGKEKAKVTD